MTTKCWKSTVIIAAATLIAGCATAPELQYVRIAKPAYAVGLIDSVYLAQSEIVIDKVATDAAGTLPLLAVTSKPVEYKGLSLGLRSTVSWRTTTKINVTKQENTDLVSSIGVETTDNTKTIIEDIGGIAVKLVGLGMMAAPFQASPCIGSTTSFPIKFVLPATTLNKSEQIRMLVGTDGNVSDSGCISVTVDPRSLDAMPIVDLPVGVNTSNYYYSACRDATLSIDGRAYRVRIADPNAAQFVQFPYKGSVTMHSQCGVSVKTDQIASDITGTRIVDALLVQAKAIKDARDAAAKKP